MKGEQISLIQLSCVTFHLQRHADTTAARMEWVVKRRRGKNNKKDVRATKIRKIPVKQRSLDENIRAFESTVLSTLSTGKFHQYQRKYRNQ